MKENCKGEKMFSYRKVEEWQELLEDLDINTFDIFSDFDQSIADEISEGLGKAMGGLQKILDKMEEENMVGED